VKAQVYSAGAAKRGLFLILSVMLLLIVTWKAAPTARASGCGANVFTFTATTANTAGYITTLDTPYTANLTLQVSQLYTGAYDPHPLGVWFDSAVGRWTIFNEDQQPMTLGTSFAIREQPTTCTTLPTWKVSRHTATASNTSANFTTLDNSVTNNDPNAAIEVTQEWTGVYNPHEVGVFYTGGHWAVFNEDGAAMPVGATFDLSMDQSLHTGFQEAYIHTATAGNTNGHITYLYESAAAFTNPNSVGWIRVTQVWTPKGVCSCVLNPHAVGLWYDPGAGRWSVYNVDHTPIPTGAAFFVTTL